MPRSVALQALRPQASWHLAAPKPCERLPLRLLCALAAASRRARWRIPWTPRSHGASRPSCHRRAERAMRAFPRARRPRARRRGPLAWKVDQLATPTTLGPEPCQTYLRMTLGILCAAWMWTKGQVGEVHTQRLSPAPCRWAGESLDHSLRVGPSEDGLPRGRRAYG